MKRTILLVALVLLLTACTVDQLKMASKAIRVSNQVAAAVEVSVQNLMAQGLLDQRPGLAIVAVTQKARTALQEASAILQTVETLEPGTARRIIGILDPVAASVQNLLNEGILGIKNPGTRQKVALALSALRMGLAAIRVALEPAATVGGQIGDQARAAEFKIRIEQAEAWLKAQPKP